jgi:uncharacterized protein (TIGR02147 family)
VSRWLRGQEGVSAEWAKKVAPKLGLSTKEQRGLVLAARAQFERSRAGRDSAAFALKAEKSAFSGYTGVGLDAFRVISDQVSLPLLSLLETEEFKTAPVFGSAGIENLARRLGVKPFQVEQSLARLEELEMIEKLGEGESAHARVTGIFFANPGGIPSHEVRAFHRRTLKRAEDALELQGVEERDYTSLVLAVDPSEMEEARTMIREFREKFEARFSQNAKRKKEVYALGI